MTGIMSSLSVSSLSCSVRAIACLYLVSFVQTTVSQQPESIPLKSDPITIDLYHKLASLSEFKPRGSILVRPRTNIRPASASLYNQVELNDEDLETLRKASESDDIYYLKASVRPKKNVQESPIRTTQTILKSCSLISSDLTDIITVNLSPSNDFISVNLRASDQACSGNNQDLRALDIEKKKFNTTVLVESSSIGPVPDTATYIKRLEEERLNKLKEGKEDNRSFFAKYWVYIVPAVVILMVFSGPGEQGAR